MMKFDGAGSAALGQFVRIAGGNVLIVLLLVGASLALTCGNSRLSRHGGSIEPFAPPSSGVTIRSEVVELWLPEVLLELTRDQSESALARTDEDLRTRLEQQGRHDLWYALTIRSHQKNGGAVVITYIRQPYREPEHFAECLEVLSWAARKIDRSSGQRFSGTRVHLVPGKPSLQELGKLVDLIARIRRS
jgi:hypothetical protein